MIIWHQTSSVFKFLSLIPILLWKAHCRKWKLVMLPLCNVWCKVSSMHPLIKSHGMMGEETWARDLPKVGGPERKSVTTNPIFFSLCLMCNYICLLPKYLQNHDHRRPTVHLTAAATVPWPEAGPVREWTTLGLLHPASPGSSGLRSLAPAVPPPPSKQRARSSHLLS